MRSLIRRLRAALPHPGTDERLLDEFVAHRADDAFAAIVRRHGPMVRGVCRRILGNDADADDAFQATFLVLVRKADAVRPRSRLGNFLYGVAVNVSRRCRDSRARRQGQELFDVPGRADADAAERNDLREVIDQELSGLPDAYRAAVVACDLEGRSRSEAAGALGWSEGTVASRLARGRALLADRLKRRGVAVAATGLAAALAPTAADAGAGVGLFQLMSGAPPAVEALATEAMKLMTTSKLKAALLTASLAAGLAGVGGATAWACGVVPLRPVATASAAKPFPLSSADAPEPKPAAAEPDAPRPGPRDGAPAGADKAAAVDGGTAKPLQVVLSNPARDVTVVSDRDEGFAAFFRRQPVMVADVLEADRDKLLYDAKGPGRVFVSYASFNADRDRTATYGAFVKLAPPPLNGPAYRLLALAKPKHAVVFVRDADDAELWHVAGVTTRPSIGFFAEAKRTPPDDFAPADLLQQPKPNK
jgi:RNA polymerase sigma factor (sigma-70 family)